MAAAGLLAGVDKMKKPELIEACKRCKIEPIPAKIGDMKYALKRFYDDAASAAAGDAAKPKVAPAVAAAVLQGGAVRRNVDGDVAYPKGPPDGKRLLAHFVCMTTEGGKWLHERGVMGQLSKAFGTELRAQYEALGFKYKLGDVQYVECTAGKTVCNVFALSKTPFQFHFKAFAEAVRDLGRKAKEQGATLHIHQQVPPYPGMDWAAVEACIDEHIVKQGIDVWVYTPSKDRAPPAAAAPAAAPAADPAAAADDSPPKKRGRKAAAAAAAGESDNSPPKKRGKKAPAPAAAPAVAAAAPAPAAPDSDDPYYKDVLDARATYIKKLCEGKALADFPIASAKPARLTKVEKESQVWYDLEDKVKLAQQSYHDDYAKFRFLAKKKPIIFKLQSAQLVENEILECRFQIKRRMMVAECAAKEARVKVGFHATHPKNIASMCKTGLLRKGHALNPCKEGSGDDGWFGANDKGVYLSRNYNYTLKYGNSMAPLEPGDKAKTIMFDVISGKVKQFGDKPGAIGPTPGFHAHTSTNDLEWFLFQEEQCCPTVICEMRAFEDSRTSADDGAKSGDDD